MTHEDIALAIGISRPTLDKHYAAELSAGAAARRVEVLESLFRAATKKGSSSAAKAYLAHAPEVAAPPLEKPEPQGKKAKANEDAKTAQKDTGWDGLLPDGVTPIRRAG